MYRMQHGNETVSTYRHKNILLVRLYRHLEGAHPVHYRPPYTLKYLQALLLSQKDYRVHLIDSAVRNLPVGQLIAEAVAWKPDVVVVSAHLREIEMSRAFVGGIQERSETLSFAVGQQVEHLTEEHGVRNRHYDFYTRGEAEWEIFQILEALNKGKANIAVLKKQSFEKYRGQDVLLVENLERFPFPRYSEEEMRGYRFLYPVRIRQKVRWGHILSSRGCPQKCIFCSQVMRDSYGDRLRLRSPESVADEMDSLVNSGANVVAFDDDNFTASRTHVEGICNELVRRNRDYNWIAHARIEDLDYQVLKKMKKSGCLLLRIGVESASSRIIRLLNKTNRPEEWTERCRKVFHMARRLGIETCALFIIGSPTEKRHEVMESIRFAREIDPDFIQVHFFTPYPDTLFSKELGDSLARGMPPALCFANRSSGGRDSGGSKGVSPLGRTPTALLRKAKQWGEKGGSEFRSLGRAPIAFLRKQEWGRASEGGGAPLLSYESKSGDERSESPPFCFANRSSGDESPPSSLTLDAYMNMHHYATPVINLSTISFTQLACLRSLFYRMFFFRWKYVFRHIRSYLLFYIFNPYILLKILSVRRLMYTYTRQERKASQYWMLDARYSI